MISTAPYDALLFLSFGGPEGPDDVLPFLENVLRGKNVPRERMLEVAEHYQHFGGVSPINEQNRQLIDALKKRLAELDMDLPIYWGNRNWHPLLPDALKQMNADGRVRALAFFTSMYSCYSGCRQYRENVANAQEATGCELPRVEKLRMGFNHPRFINAQSQLLNDALAKVPAERRSAAKVLFTAHSIPMSMSDNSKYLLQLKSTAALTAQQTGHESWELVFQSRSGPPHQPWLEPDICDRIKELADGCVKDIVIAPIGFISDHMEVLYDLDTEAKDACEQLGIGMVRTPTVGTHPEFVEMIVDLIRERIARESGDAQCERPAIGEYGPSHDVCPENCCLYPQPQRPSRPT